MLDKERAVTDQESIFVSGTGATSVPAAVLQLQLAISKL